MRIVNLKLSADGLEIEEMEWGTQDDLDAIMKLMSLVERLLDQ
jgi:hypothetical protein